MDTKALLSEIDRVLPDGGSWCSADKAHTLAAIVIALRPSLVVEIGVWSGGSLVPTLLAMQHVRYGKAIAIDPWSAKISADGEVAANAAWWGSIDHDAAYRKFVARLDILDLTHLCEIWRGPSDSYNPPDSIDLLHVDGKHTDQAMHDVDRYAERVSIGGILVLDDLHWEGGGVERAYSRALSLGFVELYKLGTGAVMQRRRSS